MDHSKLRPMEQLLLMVIQQYPGIDISELTAHIGGRSLAYVRERIRVLVLLGLVEETLASNFTPLYSVVEVA